MGTTEQTHKEDLERLKSLRYMDDDFMTVCLADNFGGCGTYTSDRFGPGRHKNQID